MEKNLVKEIVEFIKQDMSFDNSGKPKKNPVQFCDSQTGQEVLLEPASPVYDQERPAKKEETAIVE